MSMTFRGAWFISFKKLWKLHKYSIYMNYFLDILPKIPYNVCVSGTHIRKLLENGGKLWHVLWTHW